jgi:hypothetical protein
LAWPLLSLAGTPSGPREEAPAELSEDFRLEVFTSDANPAMVGVPPFAPFAPVPFTVAVQARRRMADEAVNIAVTDLTVVLMRSS